LVRRSWSFLSGSPFWAPNFSGLVACCSVSRPAAPDCLRAGGFDCRTRSVPVRLWLVALLSLLSFTPVPGAATGGLKIIFPDSAPGYGLAGILSVRGPHGESGAFAVEVGDPLQLSEQTGRWRIFAEAPGHVPLETEFEISPDGWVPVTLWLDPRNWPLELQPQARAALTMSAYAILHGYVTDASNGLPLPQVQVTAQGSSATTNSRGYFAIRLSISAPPTDSLPESTDLQVDRPGYRTLILRNTLLPEGETHLVLELRPGAGTEERDNSHKLAMPAEVVRNSQLPPEETGLSTEVPVWHPKLIGDESSLAQVIAPPDSIRVGTGCSCTSCSSVSVMSLEAYVRRGLKDEGIASWTPHSLRAGAIAYRSYGSYYVYHPLRTNYDICNTTCCQVNNPGTNGRTDSAVSYTTGILLQRNGDVFRAEYSAENNNFGCG